MKRTVFDASWKQWIKTNVDNNCDKDGIFKILLDEGFDYQAIKAQMQYEPSVPPFMLVNPLKAQQTTESQQTSAQTFQPAERFLPNATIWDGKETELYQVREFLNAEECEGLVALIKRQLRPSTLSSAEADTQFRTSSTCDLSQSDDPLVKDIDLRICRYLGIDPSYSEGIQGQHYEVGQEFKPHTDYFEQHEMASHGGQMGQRTYTFMIYLNDVTEGGETVFPKLNLACKPHRGDAVVWNSLNRDGNTNYHTLHHATPVAKGTKTIITKWFRVNSRLSPAPESSIKEANEFIPNYTRDGFFKSSVPEKLMAKINRFYLAQIALQKDEYVPGDFIVSDSKKVPSSLVELPDELRREIHHTLKPFLEEWTQSSLEPTYVYGIRIYHRGAVLKSHRDRLETHIISVIINVDQSVDEDWPLLIEDNMYRRHNVLLKPGEMVFYEGGRLIHGRPDALNGDRFANIFCHYKPVGYKHPAA